MSQGHNLKLYDIDFTKAQELAEKNGCQWFDSPQNAIADVDAVLLCTPIKETPKTIESLIYHMKKGSILCEIASLKMRTVAMLRKTKERYIRPLSVHPMFGPDIGIIEGQTVVLVPVLDQNEEAGLARRLFPDTRIVVVDAETHDRCMASILALPYFMNIAFARTLSPEKLALMRELAGTTFTVQLAVTQSIVGESHELIESLINENAFSEELLGRFIDESRRLRGLLRNKPHDFKNFCETLRSSMINEHDWSSARELRNELFELIKTHKGGKGDPPFC
jgi:prephenate dehydrogenase